MASSRVGASTSACGLVCCRSMLESTGNAKAAVELLERELEEVEGEAVRGRLAGELARLYSAHLHDDLRADDLRDDGETRLRLAGEQFASVDLEQRIAPRWRAEDAGTTASPFDPMFVQSVP